MVALAAREALAEAGMTLARRRRRVRQLHGRGGLGPGRRVPRHAARATADSSDIGGASFEAFVHHAMLAVAAGRCEVALIAYASRQRSRRSRTMAVTVDDTPRRPVRGAVTDCRSPIGHYALIAAGTCTSTARRPSSWPRSRWPRGEWARLNPKAWSRDPLTVDEVLASPMICDPLHKLDCCLRHRRRRRDRGHERRPGARTRPSGRSACSAPARATRHWHISQMPD